MFQVANAHRLMLEEKRLSSVKVEESPESNCKESLRTAKRNVSKLALTKKISRRSRSLALVMVEAQMKATKTPLAVISPFT